MPQPHDPDHGPDGRAAPAAPGPARDDEPPRAGLLDTVKAVGASFFGVRGRSAHEQDMRRLNPLHVILVGIALAAVFVLTLVGIARMVASR
jgi:hypothetical protein